MRGSTEADRTEVIQENLSHLESLMSLRLSNAVPLQATENTTHVAAHTCLLRRVCSCHWAAADRKWSDLISTSIIFKGLRATGQLGDWARGTDL